MKKIEHIRKHYNYITESQAANLSKLENLSRAGLLEVKKIPFIKRAFDKDPANLTLAERKIVLELLDKLISESVANTNLTESSKDGGYLSKYDTRVGNQWPSDKDMPTILVLKRKSVRVYPDHQKVALYYSQYLDKYVSIPFGPGQITGIPMVNEESKPTMGVDWDSAYNEYKKKHGSRYSDPDTEDKFTKDRDRLKRFVFHRAEEGKIHPRHWQNVRGHANDPDREKLQKVSNQAMRDNPNISGSNMIDYGAFRLGQATGNALRRLTGRTTGIKTAAPTTSAPSQPKTSLQTKGKATASFAPTQTHAIIAQAKQKVAAKSAPPSVSVSTPKPTKVKKTPVVPGTGEQPTVTGNFAQPEKKIKTATFSSNLAPARQLTPLETKTGTVNQQKQLPRKRYAGIDPKVPGTGPQPVIGKVKPPKAALMKKLQERKDLNEQTANAIRLAPHVARGLGTAATIGAGAAAGPAIAGGIAAAGAGYVAAKTYQRITDPEERKKAEAERAGEAEAGASFDAKKAQIKLQRASERDDAEIAARSGTNVKNMPKVSAPKAKSADISPSVAVAKPAVTAPAPVAPPVSAPTAVSPPVSAPPIRSDVADAMNSAAKTAPQANVDAKSQALAKADELTKEPKPDKKVRRRYSDDDDDKTPNKYLSPDPFGLKVNLSAPNSQVKTAVDARLKNAYRKSFETVKENRDSDYYTSSNTSTSTISTKPFSLQTKVSAPKGQVSTGIDARMKGLERRYYQSISEDNFKTIKNMVKNNINEMNINIDENHITINNIIANKIVSVHESLSKDNKKKMENMLNESVDSLKKIISFAIRQ